ncbi:hypothetical protein VTN00DRAFT_6693 [Thermoascus crustaceus]|uniref:uncharacterized protein n=1 Tax=Thermoascus crustaceus TaxID=5088 RepID=UPI0037422669
MIVRTTLRRPARVMFYVLFPNVQLKMLSLTFSGTHTLFPFHPVPEASPQILQFLDVLFRSFLLCLFLLIVFLYAAFHLVVGLYPSWLQGLSQAHGLRPRYPSISARPDASSTVHPMSPSTLCIL